LVNDACKYDDGQLRYINFRSLLSILYLALAFLIIQRQNFENNNGEAVLTSNVSASKSSLLETVDI
jgi:hypothetical protein